ncbi:MAG: TetR/AcrR family transcriptional regulator [Burkholderiaceae bacterium]
MTDSNARLPRKGDMTRAAILDAALALASRNGLEGLTIGALAEKTGMSKSGVFAHFGSREELQIAVVKRYHQQFEQEVFAPSIREPRGLPRLEAMFAHWVRRVTVEIASGCIYISGAVEYDDRPGAIRDELVRMVRTWQEALLRCVRQAIELGHLREETDPAQVVYEIYGLILALHHDARFLRMPGSAARAESGFARLIDASRNPTSGTGRRAAPRPRSTAAKAA